MKFGTGIIIFFLALIALVAEIILYFIFGFGAAMSGGGSALMGVAAFFVWLMIMTVAIGVLAPLCAIVEQVTKRENLSFYLMIPTLIVLGLFLGVVFALVGRSVKTNLTSSANTRATTQQKSSNPAEQEALAYLNKIEVKNLEVGQTARGTSGIFGEVKNTGDRTLRKVEITIYFLNKDGNPISETIYHPVLVSETGITDDKPLKPGYSRKFGVKADDAPNDWAKKVDVKVTNVEFER